MIINSNKRVLDYNSQLVRIFEKFFLEYDDISEANGIYDIIILHREGIQDNFEDVKEYTHSDTKFIIDITTESGNLQTFLDYFKNLTDLSNFKFYLFVDSNLTNYINNVSLKYEVIHAHELLYYAHTNVDSDCLIKLNRNRNIKFVNSYMSFNGSMRPQRILLLLHLLKNNIQIDNTSFLLYMKTDSGYKFVREEYEGMLNEMKSSDIINNNEYNLLKNVKLPKSLDYECGVETLAFNSVDDSYSYPINFVTENVTGLVKGDESPFELITFSEKTIKPFLAHQLPLIFGVYGLQKKLRELGFDLFDDYIDHKSYENIKDAHTRLKIMVLELKRLLEFDNVEFRKNNTHRFISNHLKIFELSNKGFDILNNFYKSNIL